MDQSCLSKGTYYSLFLLLAIVYSIGLFIPLMDNDSAHHANIALHMYLTGNYVDLIDNGKDYLDKPHLHFWLAALSYHIFGVTGFAYKFPSFLFTILGTYSTYRLGRSLYDHNTGKLAALIVATAFAYILANNDVRMDAILTACIVFATWQLVDWVNHKRLINALGAALGLAMGFCTKGHIAVVTPAVSIFFYIWYKREWKALLHWQLAVIIAGFFILIAPVVYCYYLQYDLHPEKVVRGRSHITGVQFILWGQSIERFAGEDFGGDSKNDYFFFFHSFLWAFAPWSIMAFVAFVSRLKSFITHRYEWLTIGTLFTILLLITFSGFKLPHYLNIIFPVSAILTASYIRQHERNKTVVKRLAVLQVVLCTLCLLTAGIINIWAFPVHGIWVIVGFLLLIAVVFFLLKTAHNQLARTIIVTVAASIIVFYLLNANFYPQLLKYQGGNELAFDTKDKVDPKQVYFWPEVYSSSYSFYTSELRKPFTDSIGQQQQPVWIMIEGDKLNELQAKRLPVLKVYSHIDYEITRLSLKFINPSTRVSECGKLMLVKVK